MLVSVVLEIDLPDEIGPEAQSMKLLCDSLAHQTKFHEFTVRAMMFGRQFGPTEEQLESAVKGNLQ